MAFHGKYLVNIAHFASQQGFNANELMESSGILEGILNQNDDSLPHEVYNKLFENALTLTLDPYFGLHVGENFNIQASALIGQLTKNAETVVQVLELACQSFNQECSSLSIQLLENSDSFQLKITIDPIWGNQHSIVLKHTIDLVLALFVRKFESLNRATHRPLTVHLPWDSTAKKSEYERVFSCPVNFQQEDISIFLEKSQVKKKIISSNFDVFRTLVQLAQTSSNQLKNDSRFYAKVKLAIIHLSNHVYPSIEEVSAHLNLSKRTLQRRLKSEGYIYKNLVDELRKDFALAFLKTELNVSEVADLLNYADASSFTRTFKRWTGKTPKSYQLALV
jgi:AraC-like DNA-binding protein